MIFPQSILMPLASTGNEQERILGALSVTRFFAAHLEVLHAQAGPQQFIPDDAIVRRMPHSLLHELEALAEKYSTREADDLQKLFVSLCKQQGVTFSDRSLADSTTAFWREVTGLRSELIGERGKVNDLVIIPQSKTGKASATLEAAVMRSGKPVLLMPRTQTHFSAERVIIAWNGSTEGARAVTHALPLLQQAREVVIATSLSSAYRKPAADELQVYLQRHGIEAVTRGFNSRHKSAGEALLALASDLKSELLVMGAYTHQRVHEQIFGGMTRYMVGHAKIPIFMMH